MARLITLQTFLDRGDALFLRSFLEAHGFFVLAADEAITGQDWMKALAIGGVRVQVMDSELADIRALLCDAGLIQQPGEDVGSRSLADARLPFHRRSGVLRRHFWRVLAVSALLAACGAVVLDAYVALETERLYFQLVYLQLATTVVLALATEVFPMVLPLLRNRHPGFAVEPAVAQEPEESEGIQDRDLDPRSAGLTTLRRYHDPRDAEESRAFLEDRGFFAVRADETGGSVLDFRVLVRQGELDRILAAIEAAGLRASPDELSTGTKDTKEIEGPPSVKGLPGLLSRNLELLLLLAVLALMVAGPVWRLLSES